MVRGLDTRTLNRFRKTVWKHYQVYGRHDLPWRKTHDPYRILVSEIMLQQTQVGRVIPFYKNFLERFPNVQTLARAPLSSVLQVWQGLGYNRRAKMLWQAAQEVVSEGKGKFPKSAEELDTLPGIGPYTARAVAAFAHNDDVVFIETNIRTVITHHFFPTRKKVNDKVLFNILEKVFPKGRAREWYAALMDYGAYLKQLGVRINHRSAHYVKQKQFKGSNREARGALLRELARGARGELRLMGLLGDDRTLQIQTQLKKLLAEGLIEKRGKVFTLPR